MSKLSVRKSSIGRSLTPFALSVSKGLALENAVVRPAHHKRNKTLTAAAFIAGTTLLAALLGVALLPTQALAAGKNTQASPPPSINAITQKLQAAFGAEVIEKVQPSAQLPGWYEVITPSELAYTNADGSVLFAGRLVDTTTKANLTGQRWNEINRINVGELPLDQAINIVKGDGSRKLYLFSDPDCPYCQELEQQLKDVTDITIYTFLYPLEAIHPQARERANNIWCSAYRPKVWNDWMQTRQLPSAQCEQRVVADNIALGAKLKINATPTLFFADGHRVNGAISKEQLERELTSNQ